jgi:hypothetical protein
MDTANCGCPTDDEFVYHNKKCANKSRRPWRYVRIEFKPRDLWIGAYWKRLGNTLDLWVCLLPCLPIHFCWVWSREP